MSLKVKQENMMDVLFDVLRVIRLSGAVFFTAEFSSPWAVLSPASWTIAPSLTPGSQCLSMFHVLAQGSCWASVNGEPAVQMAAGDLVVVPHGDEHVLASDPSVKPTPIGDILHQIPSPGMQPVVYGGGGDVTRFVCGFLCCDQKFEPLFSTLPRLLFVRTHKGEVVVKSASMDFSDAPVPLHAGMWLNTTLSYLIQEAWQQKPGNQSVLARLTETMFVEVLRHHMQGLAADQKGWLAGLNDPQVSRALALLHGEPTRSWTVEDLARAAGVSRSGLADRFTELIGESPIRYLTGWRMHLARQLLTEGSLSAGEIAVRVGYDSEYAFNRAFKRHVGQPPATWRKKVSALQTTR
jgi:AraC family transcriptional regulator, alkane utilization regulator